jgi:hypothetical protein
MGQISNGLCVSGKTEHSGVGHMAQDWNLVMTVLGGLGEVPVSEGGLWMRRWCHKAVLSSAAGTEDDEGILGGKPYCSASYLGGLPHHGSPLTSSTCP